ncbi:MAG: hypothetical protein JWQ63_69 [Mucilaginibacter sp.]|jgi:hypothetical protein|nr:hypothetical protein [Mucilaginibacter sp.]
MNKIFTILFLAMFAVSVNAQTNPTNIPTVQPYGKIDIQDFEMKSCDFEKDANAEVLFDSGSVYFNPAYELVFERHVRVKIFNEKAKQGANVKLQYFDGYGLERIQSLEAETINYDNGKIEFTKVDKKLIYNSKIDRIRKEMVFSFPNVKSGSVLEYKYILISKDIVNFPAWYFQSNLPTRYSELKTDIPNVLYYKILEMVNRPYVKHTADVKALANIPSLNDEPFMTSSRDNSERILYQLKSISQGSFYRSILDTWEKVGKNLCDYDGFGGQFKRKLTGEEEIINKAKNLSSDNDKIAFIFNEVKNKMKWDSDDFQFINDGTSEAWDKKTGNSTEINLVLYHLLKKSGVQAYPMLVSTRKNGKINPAYPNSYQFNRTVAYIPIDTANFYILDATNKYNLYNEIPADLLNGFGFCIDVDNQKFKQVFLEKNTTADKVISINAEIKPEGKLMGTAELVSYSYNRINEVEKYKTDGEQKYIDYLRGGDNNLKISGITFENMEVDSLPLMQNIDFNLDLTGSDGNYIYLNPNLFTGLRLNPFLSENRFTDIDFGYTSSYSINGLYKLPAGYKTDAIPQNINMSMPDKSIVFRRTVAEQNGQIMVRCIIKYQKSLFFKEDYPEFHEFFKKMYEMLNEQIVLKKS